MLRQLLTKIFRKKALLTEKNIEDCDALFAEGHTLHANSDYRAAQNFYLRYLQVRPYDFAVMNELACCLASAGDEAAAVVVFEQAYLLDDTHIPVAVNYASVLRSRGRADEALEILTKAQIQAPKLANIYNIYSAIQFSLGNVDSARKFSLRGWLAAFDDLRLANCFLFNSAYTDIDGQLLAAEHRFWAETLRPVKNDLQFVVPHDIEPSVGDRKVRVGYWSPDLRSHSVRLFFRPLLEAHDKTKFEIFVYHDSHLNDEQTAAIQLASDHFIDCALLSNDELGNLFLTHELDVLVEMAGHSSTNRLPLLKKRFAKLQVTGIGYPPTTGLATIDVKIVDRHILKKDASNYYTEQPADIGESFWCFDPKEKIDLPRPPPVQQNGFVTFGCVGNIAKISSRIMRCWAEILLTVPDSRLLIRAINFSDPAAERNLNNALNECGIDLTRVDLKKPAGSAAFYDSYNEIDIALDTFPFNGGTTSCFAAYMGVPIVSLAGDSLISRMGKSILENLGLSDWVVEDDASYVRRAVRGAGDTAFLSRFRLEARQRFLASPLGNGTMFARDMERFFVKTLDAYKEVGRSQHQHSVKALPAGELMQRAYYVYRYGQLEAGRRIVEHCLTEHPHAVGAQILWTERLTSKGKFGDAADYLIDRFLAGTSSAEHIQLVINAVRFRILDDDLAAAAQHLKYLLDFTNLDILTRLQVAQLRAALSNSVKKKQYLDIENLRFLNVCVLIVAESSDEFTEIRDQLLSCAFAPEKIKFHHCKVADRGRYLEAVISGQVYDTCILIHRNVRICNSNFWLDIAVSLVDADLVGVQGANRWEKIDWDCQPLDLKSGCVIVPSGEKDNYFEVHFHGLNPSPLINGMAVLRGSFLALNLTAIRTKEPVKLDFSLSDGGVWMEELFTHRAMIAGCRLAVHQALGVMIDWRVVLDEKYMKEARLEVAKSMNFEQIFDIDDGDERVISVAVNSHNKATSVQKNFLQQF